MNGQEQEKNPLKWEKVEIKLTSIDGEQKSFTYQAPYKIEAIKNFMWRISKKNNK